MSSVKRCHLNTIWAPYSCFFIPFSIRMTAEVPEKSWELSHYEMHRKAQPLMSSKEAPTTVSSKVSTKRFATQKPTYFTLVPIALCFSVYIQTSGARFAWTCWHRQWPRRSVCTASVPSASSRPSDQVGDQSNQELDRCFTFVFQATKSVPLAARN